MSPIAVYAGSFDPFTNGHLHVLTQALQLFDTIYLVIARHPTKKRFLPEQAVKKSLVQLIAAADLSPRVSVAIHPGLTLNFAHARNTSFLIRGLRSPDDYAYEEDLATYNFHHGHLQTIYFRAEPYAAISSSRVLQLFQQGKNVSDLVPPATLELLNNYQTSLNPNPPSCP